MGKGLKQMVAEAEAASDEREEIQPVIVSGDSHAVMAEYVRKWTGHKDAVLSFSDPRTEGAPSAWAAWSLDQHRMVVNIDALLLNPYRVLLTVTPFRLRQEAVMTGAILHEAAHARNSGWILEHGQGKLLHTPRAGALKKSERKITDETVALAKLIEEARIEGIMARECNSIGAMGLEWTMRAMAAHLLPPTVLSEDPDQMLMDIISSWVLRAGRQYAVARHLHGFNPARWVEGFNSVLHDALTNHFRSVDLTTISGQPFANEFAASQAVISMLIDAVQIGAQGNSGPGCVDRARDILDVLFPETSGGAGKPTPSGGCQEGESQPDTGSESAEQGGGAGEGEDDSLEAMLKELDSASDDALREMQATALEMIESQADEAVKDEASEEEDKTPPTQKSRRGAGQGGDAQRGGFREPTPQEREVKKRAAAFLRSVIDPSQASRTSLSESPSATVDPAALAEWRAGGQVREPRFFKRTHRSVVPSPPVKIGVLVDVSLSMGVLAYPSALLSYALASAAVDLRNFAGRGVQIESTLIHWGTEVKVIQANGQSMPGIYRHDANQGTSVMHLAHEELERQIPGFHSVSEKPENRLLIHFTDWILGPPCNTEVIEPISKALAAGVNILSVVPTIRQSHLDTVLNAARAKRTAVGTHTLMEYNPRQPEAVWDLAREIIRG